MNQVATYQSQLHKIDFNNNNNQRIGQAQVVISFLPNGRGQKVQIQFKRSAE